MNKRGNAIRILVAIFVGIAISTLLCGCGGGGGAPATAALGLGSGSNASSARSGGGSGGTTVDTTPPAVVNAAVDPTPISESGGSVTISARVTDDVAVGTVAAIITKPNGSTVTISLSGSGTYTGTFAAPANSAGSDQTYTVRVDASDTTGNTVVGPTTSFIVSSLDYPPPPPSF